MVEEIELQPYGYIYKITNLITGKIYIGQRKFYYNYKDNLEYLGSGVLIKKSPFNIIHTTEFLLLLTIMF